MIHTPGRCGILQSTPLSAHFRLGIGSDTKLSHPDLGPHRISGSTPPYHDIVCFGPRPRPHDFVSGNSREQNFLVGHPSWECSGPFSLNFGVSTKSEASELLKGLVLGRDGNIHIRLTRSTPLDDVGSYSRCHVSL